MAFVPSNIYDRNPPAISSLQDVAAEAVAQHASHSIQNDPGVRNVVMNARGRAVSREHTNPQAHSFLARYETPREASMRFDDNHPFSKNFVAYVYARTGISHLDAYTQSHDQLVSDLCYYGDMPERAARLLIKRLYGDFRAERRTQFGLR